MVVLAFQHYFAYVAAMCVLLYLQNTHKPKRLIRYIRHWADFFVYFAKNSVNAYCRRVRPACTTWTKFCPTLLKFKEAATKNRRALGARQFFVRR